jgi:hypothetical protein
MIQRLGTALAYLGSCVRETITGGTVIGADASDVRSGDVSCVNLQRKSDEMVAHRRANSIGGPHFSRS